MNIEKYLNDFEVKLYQAKQIPISFEKLWYNDIPNKAGVYLVRFNGEPCYIGEGRSLRARIRQITSTYNHTLKRNIGHEVFASSPGFKRASSKQRFPDNIELLINDYMKTNLTVSWVGVELGRVELEEMLIRKHSNRLTYNKKGKN